MMSEIDISRLSKAEKDILNDYGEDVLKQFLGATTLSYQEDLDSSSGDGAVDDTDKNKPSHGTTMLFLGLSLLYLIPEIIFNTQLVHEVAYANTAGDIHSIELFGRFISGIGLSLMVASLIAKRIHASLKTSALFVLPLSFLVCWPLMFYGQTYVVKWIADYSNAEERRNSYIALGIKNAMRVGAIEFEGVPYKSGLDEEFDDTLLVMAGALIYSNKSVLDLFESDSDKIIDTYFKYLTTYTFDDRYEDYKLNGDYVKSLYKEYVEGAKSYNSIVNEEFQKADKIWFDLQEALFKGWGKYQRLLEGTKSHYNLYAIVSYPELVSSLSKIRERKSTYEKERKRINYDVLKLPELDYPSLKELSDRRGNPIDFIGYQRKLSKALIPKFESAYDIPYGIESYLEYAKQERVLEDINYELRYNGKAEIKKEWDPSNRESFDKLVIEKIEKTAKPKWYEEVYARTGYKLEPNLSWEEFQKTDLVQDSIRERLGSNYIPMTFDFNNVEFKKFIFDPILVKQKENILNKIDSSTQYFEKGAELYEQSRITLQSVLIPPISMGISLLLILWSSFSIVMGIVQMNVKEHNEVSRNALKILPVVFLVFVYVAPVYLVNLRSDGNSFALNAMLDNTNALASKGIEWALSTQPIIQKAGMIVSDKVPLYEYFKESDIKSILEEIE